MTSKDFWRNSTVGVFGGGNWGSVLANLTAKNCREVRIWLRDEESVRSINTTRTNRDYLPTVNFDPRVHAYSELDRFFEGGLQAVIWALPAAVCREQSRAIAKFFKGDELLLHATKGIEAETMKRISQVLLEEIPCRRIGVISGPNLAAEVARGEPAATVVASEFDEVCDAGFTLLNDANFRVHLAKDVIGVEWAGALKNILAIASGALDALKLGWNSRAVLMTQGLSEMVGFSKVMGADESTFLGLAGIGDLLATCSSSLSRNYQVGLRLGRGESLRSILDDLGSVAEGVHTTFSIWEFASKHGIQMPITQRVYQLLKGEVQPEEILKI